MQVLKKLRLILDTLSHYEIIDSLNKVSFFYDEPKFYLYHCAVKNFKNYTDGIIPQKATTSLGVSFTSSKEALLKCLVEAVERISLYCFRKKTILFSSFNNFKNKDRVVDPYLYRKDSSVRQLIFGWTKTYNLINDQNYLIPAQFVYLNHRATYDEFFLTTNNSTGAAGGFDYASTLLRGIYEIIERDTFLTIYLSKIQAPRIDPDEIKNSTITSVSQKLKQYKLELYVFDITTDLAIPSFATILIDKTGCGPAVSVGLKANLDIVKAITGSMSEALAMRSIVRQAIMTENKTGPMKKGFYWSSTKMIKKLNFLLDQPVKKFGKKSLRFKTDEQELLYIKQVFKKKGLNIYFVDITLNIFKKIGYKAYKVIIPHLQSMYIPEAEKELSLNIERIKKITQYFGLKKFRINVIPHPLV